MACCCSLIWSASWVKHGRFIPIHRIYLEENTISKIYLHSHLFGVVCRTQKLSPCGPVASSMLSGWACWTRYFWLCQTKLETLYPQPEELEWQVTHIRNSLCSISSPWCEIKRLDENRQNPVSVSSWEEWRPFLHRDKFIPGIRLFTWVEL